MPLPRGKHASLELIKTVVQHNNTMSTEPENQPAPDVSEADSAQPQPPTESMPSTESQLQPAAESQPADDAAKTVEVDAPAATAAALPAKGILIGSQRDVADPKLKQIKPVKPKAVSAAQDNPVALNPSMEAPSPQPTGEVKSTAGLSDDIEAEIEAAIGDISMDQVVGNIAEGEELEENSRVKATVAKIHGENVFFSIKGQYEGIVPKSQFKELPKEGDFVELIVRGRNEEDGLYELNMPGSAMSVSDWEDLSEGSVIEVRCSGSNTGGLEVMAGTVRGFIPASQIDRFRVENFGEYVNQKMQCVVMEVNPAKRKLVLSRRAVLDRENEEKRKEIMASIEAGQTYDGIVTKVMDFGAFVDIGGVEGLVHVSKLSWDHVTKPQDVITAGEKVKVKIETVNSETGKIGLSRRDTMEHPWENISADFATNDIVTGTVTRIADFGAFVKLRPGVEGLVHISELAHHRVMKVSNYVNRGDEVQVKILSMDLEKQKIGLSIKATQTKPVKASDKKKEEVDEPLREAAIKKSDEPLKGGTNRKSGGESVGLNW